MRRQENRQFLALGFINQELLAKVGGFLKNSLQENFFLFSVGVLLGGSVVFFLGITFLRFCKKKVRKKGNQVEYRVAEGDSIMSLEKKFKIKWRTLAQVNKIKPPYHLKPGQIMLIPAQGVVSFSQDFDGRKKTFETKALATKGASARVVLSKAGQLENKMSQAQISAPGFNLRKVERMFGRDGSEGGKKKNKPSFQKEKNQEMVFPPKGIRPKKIEEKTKEKTIKKKRGIFFWAMILLIILLLSGIGFWKKGLLKDGWGKIVQVGVFNKEDSQETENNQSEMEPEQKTDGQEEEQVEQKEELIPIMTPQEVELLVLNGGAKAGAAGRMKTFLVEAGYEKTVAENSEGEGYEGVVVYYSPERQGEAELIEQLLRKGYQKVSIKEAVSEEEKQKEIVVIVAEEELLEDEKEKESGEDAKLKEEENKKPETKLPAEDEEPPQLVQ